MLAAELDIAVDDLAGSAVGAGLRAELTLLELGLTGPHAGHTAFFPAASGALRFSATGGGPLALGTPPLQVRANAVGLGLSWSTGTDLSGSTSRHGGPAPPAGRGGGATRGRRSGPAAPGARCRRHPGPGRRRLGGRRVPCRRGGVRGRSGPPIAAGQQNWSRRSAGTTGRLRPRPGNPVRPVPGARRPGGRPRAGGARLPHRGAHARRLHHAARCPARPARHTARRACQGMAQVVPTSRRLPLLGTAPTPRRTGPALISRWPSRPASLPADPRRSVVGWQPGTRLALPVLVNGLTGEAAVDAGLAT